MQYRKLGDSDLTVSEIALGSWLTYSGGVEKDQSIACVKRALDLGITLIDTANIYGKGAAETVLGEALAGVRRDSYVLATKLFFPMTETDKGLSRAQIEKQLDASLERLRVDHVDLYQCHRYDPETPLDETMEALTAAVKSGKTRYIGFSEWPVEKIREATEMMGVTKFVSSQPQYSMIWRKPEDAVIPYCAAHGISQIVWSPLGQGILTGKYQPGARPPAGSRATSASMGHFLQDLTERRAVLEAVQAMQPLAQQAGLTLAQFALAWVLREPNVAAAIIGASRPAQIDENVKASGAQVDPALFTRAEALLVPALQAA
ncbi:aldo/keto reductase family protein [Acidiphilium sp. PA]|uniref:aldo/keto reductase family protein n=1 Tax=Acidiphilium sp. PA TaxID=2871705 RepID=UPI002242D926|nr:aldo/keto reductase family protein [Acidiphilium sp. PA]MCW8306959.1 aldo/keto reductase family protein [Acidiphilium sp. PA]